VERASTVYFINALLTYLLNLHDMAIKLTQEINWLFVTITDHTMESAFFSNTCQYLFRVEMRCSTVVNE